MGLGNLATARLVASVLGGSLERQYGRETESDNGTVVSGLKLS